MPSMTSRCDSIDVIQSSADGDYVTRHRPGAIRSTSAATIASKNAANDGVSDASFVSLCFEKFACNWLGEVTWGV